VQYFVEESDKYLSYSTSSTCLGLMSKNIVHSFLWRMVISIKMAPSTGSAWSRLVARPVFTINSTGLGHPHPQSSVTCVHLWSTGVKTHRTLNKLPGSYVRRLTCKDDHSQPRRSVGEDRRSTDWPYQHRRRWRCYHSSSDKSYQRDSVSPGSLSLVVSHAPDSVSPRPPVNTKTGWFGSYNYNYNEGI